MTDGEWGGVFGWEGRWFSKGRRDCGRTCLSLFHEHTFLDRRPRLDSLGRAGPQGEASAGLLLTYQVEPRQRGGPGLHCRLGRFQWRQGVKRTRLDTHLLLLVTPIDVLQHLFLGRKALGAEQAAELDAAVCLLRGKLWVFGQHV